MKKILVIFFFANSIQSSHAQTEKYFELTDTRFEKDMICVKEISFSFSHCMYFPEFQPMIDSIAIFLRNNSKVVVEIGDHVDSRGSDDYNIKLSKCRAGSVIDNLLTKGDFKDRIVGKGYGHTKPRLLEKDYIGFESAYTFPKGTILTQEYINSLNDNTDLGKKKFEDAHRLNRRLEIKIIAIQ